MEDKKQGNAGNSRPHKTGSQIQSAILSYIKEHCKGFVVAYKVEIASERGVPDLLFCINGKFIGIEVKGTGDHLTAIQAAQAKRIYEAGGKAFVVKSLEDFKNIIKEI